MRLGSPHSTKVYEEGLKCLLLLPHGKAADASARTSPVPCTMERVGNPIHARNAGLMARSSKYETLSKLLSGWDLAQREGGFKTSRFDRHTLGETRE